MSEPHRPRKGLVIILRKRKARPRPRSAWRCVRPQRDAGPHYQFIKGGGRRRATDPARARAVGPAVAWPGLHHRAPARSTDRSGGAPGAFDRAWDFAREQVVARDQGVVILDEIMGSIKAGHVTTEEVANLNRAKPAGLHLVLTGRNAPRSSLIWRTSSPRWCR